MIAFVCKLKRNEEAEKVIKSASSLVALRTFYRNYRSMKDPASHSLMLNNAANLNIKRTETSKY